MRLPPWGALLGAAGFAGGSAAARQAPQGISWRPALPLQGAVVSLRLRPDSLAVSRASPVELRGDAAGEALHFEAEPGGAFWALAPIPLRTRDTLKVRVSILRSDSMSDTLTIGVPIAARVVDTERIRMPAAFRQALDSALAARIAAEREGMSGVGLHSHDTPRMWSETFIRPVPGRVTEKFGVWRAWDGMIDSRHDGVDLAGAAGAIVRAANRGVVARVADQYYGGVTVLIDHGAGLVTSYQHLSRATVAVGDTVARGAVIGRVGTTGRVTGPHLHWGASYGSVTLDPLSLLTVAPPLTRRR